MRSAAFRPRRRGLRRQDYRALSFVRKVVPGEESLATAPVGTATTMALRANHTDGRDDKSIELPAGEIISIHPVIGAGEP